MESIFYDDKYQFMPRDGPEGGTGCHFGSKAAISLKFSLTNTVPIFPCKSFNLSK